MKEKMVFKKNLRRLLEQNNLNQAEFAKKIGVTEATVSRYVNGNRIPSTKIIGKIMKTLDCTYDELFEEGKENSQLEDIFSKMISSLNQSEKNYLISKLKNKN